MLLRRLPRLALAERGFTLIELLVVIMLIGVLATIALPLFLGKRELAYDADAKSSARNLVSYMDSCFVPNEDFTKCATQAENGADDLDWGTGPGQVSVVDTSKASYTIEAVSKAQTGGAYNVFTVERSAGASMSRTCSGASGCKNGTW